VCFLGERKDVYLTLTLPSINITIFRCLEDEKKEVPGKRDNAKIEDPFCDRS